MSLNFTRIEIKSAHSMDSWSGGILVTVSGSTQFKDLKVRREFLQTFFLAPQEKGYFVLNDIFHFVSEEPVPVPPPSLLMHADVDSQHIVSNSSLQEPVADYIFSGEVEPPEFVPQTHPDETTTTEEYSLPEQQQLPESNDIAQESFEDYGSTPYSAVDNTMVEMEPAPDAEPVEPVKQTYASILRVAKGLSGSAPAPSASMNQSASLNSDWQQIPQATTYSSNQPQTAAAFPDKVYPEVTDEIGTVEEDGGQIVFADMTKSVYVRNLSTTVSAFEIEQAFSGFGQIKPDGVVVRSRKDVGICYAFVEFEDTSSVQNAVMASPIQIGGRQVHIEERRPNTSSSRGRRGRGRGGYPVDIQPRGRGQFSTRYSGRGTQEGDGSYGARSRGNDYSLRGSRPGVSRNYTSRNGQSQSDAF